MNLTVIGGSSVGTPVLLKELNAAVAKGDLPDTHVRLFGRNQLRLERVLAYSRLRNDTTCVSVSTHQDLESALTDATHVLCQIRPGGMEFRAKAERAALAAGIPGDEGLGPGGLAVFLFGRSSIQNVIDQCARYAPNALFMQMSSPLGLFVALACRTLPGPAYGVCELPAVTVRKVLNLVQSNMGLENLGYSLAGLNHQSWLYAFRDSEKTDRTSEILGAIDDPELVGVEPDLIRQIGAVPVPYLKLFIHRDREFASQFGQSSTRGEELAAWNNDLDHAYCGGLQPDCGQVSALLRCRDMSWYRYGVVPALQAFVSREDRSFPLNLENHGAIAGIDDTAIVEVLCKVGNGVAKPLKTAALPDWPAKLTQSLVAYEQLALGLPEQPTVRQLEEVLALHPMVPRQSIRAAAIQVRAVASALP
jgi:6-phospho-beta-glucosidase